MYPCKYGTVDALQQVFESSKNPVKQLEQFTVELQTEQPFEQADIKKGLIYAGKCYLQSNIQHCIILSKYNPINKVLMLHYSRYLKVIKIR